MTYTEKHHTNFTMDDCLRRAERLMELAADCEDCDNTGQNYCSSCDDYRRDAAMLRRASIFCAHVNIMKVCLEPNDVLVFESPERLTTKQLKVMSDVVKEIWPTRKALVCDNSVRLKVISELEIKNNDPNK